MSDVFENPFNSVFDPEDYIDWWMPTEEEFQEHLLYYVPEAEFLEWDESIMLGTERANEAADLLMESLIEGGVM